MMDAVRFMKMDFIKMKTQAKFMALVVLIVIVFFGKMMGETMGVFSIMYMIFMGILLCYTPFGIDSMVADGFIRLLPARAKYRVFGRFMFAAVFLTVCAVCGSLVSIPSLMKDQITASEILVYGVMFYSAGLCINSLQYVFCYFFEIKSQQLLSLFRLLWGFLFFIGGSYLIELSGEMQEDTLNQIGKVLNYVMEHQGVAALVLLAAAVIFTMFCAVVCGKREERKEA